MRSGFTINKCLYKARLDSKYTLKEAAYVLCISKLHLSLIEKGYLNVSKKLQPRFILTYKLSKDFFEKRSTYVVPIEVDEENKELDKKFYQKMSKKRHKIIAFSLLLISLGAVAFGAYGINKRFINPRAPWSETFTKFYDKMKKVGTSSKSILDLDTIYTVKREGDPYPVGDVTYNIVTSITIYDKETSSHNTNIDSSIQKKGPIPGGGIDVIEKFSFYLFSYNKKKIIFITYGNQQTSTYVTLATSIIDNGEITLREFDYIFENKTYHAKIGSEEYNNLLNASREALKFAFMDVDILLNEKGLYYVDGNDLLSDVQVISRDYVFYSRIGNSFVICFSLVAAISLLIGGLSIYSSYKLKPKTEEKINPDEIPIISRDIPVRGIVNDIKFPEIFPEALLRVTGLIILALSSISLFASIYLVFNKSFIGIDNVDRFKAFTSTFLSSAVLLLFFVKLDVYARKSRASLINNIIFLFMGGLVYYIAEILLYRSILVEGNIFSLLLRTLVQVIPGNIIWNIMLYSLIFFFLFTLPDKYVGNPAKILKWRLCSLFPTFFLLFALFFKSFLEDIVPSAYYFSFLFHTSGVITTIFAIVYIYTLYFLNLRNFLIFGKKNADIYSYSKRYALEKNIIASIIIFILFLIDLFFMYRAPDNPLKLGKNWPIVFLIPFILLYRPHIGKRNKQWDNIYTLLYGVCFAGGYVSILFYILSKMNISELMYLLF